MPSEIRDTACFYGFIGWHICPLRQEEKRPATANGMKNATADLATIFDWWTDAPYANIGVVCDKSGLVVLDYDPRNGQNALGDAEDRYGTLPETPWARTGGGGIHVLFKCPPDTNFRREIIPGLDIKCNGYIVAPPSRVNGNLYEWGISPEEIEIANLPTKWLEIATRPKFPGQQEMETVKLQRLEEGLRREPHTDLLKNIPADEYVQKLTGRVAGLHGWVQCPFHKEGHERTPSFLCTGILWACFACEPIAEKQVMGGNIYDFAGLVMGYPLPLDSFAYSIVRTELLNLFPHAR